MSWIKLLSAWSRRPVAASQPDPPPPDGADLMLEVQPDTSWWRRWWSSARSIRIRTPRRPTWTTARIASQVEQLFQRAGRPGLIWLLVVCALVVVAGGVGVVLLAQGPVGILLTPIIAKLIHNADPEQVARYVLQRLRALGYTDEEVLAGVQALPLGADMRHKAVERVTIWLLDWKAGPAA